MADIRSPRVRGDYHRFLVALLLRKIAEGACTQESLAGATGMHQTTISGILKRGAGTLDLDEAAAALDHIGGSLREFIADPEHMPTTKLPVLPRRLAKLLQIVDVFDEKELAIVMATARSVRARHDADKRSARRRVADLAHPARKTGGRR